MTDADTDADLDTAVIMTGRVEEMARFYRDGLGVTRRIERSPGHLGFQVGRVYLGFDQVESADAAGRGAVTLWFRVGDLEATFTRFVDLGADVRYAPKDMPWGDRLACVLDPDGNVVGLSQRKREKPLLGDTGDGTPGSD